MIACAQNSSFSDGFLRMFSVNRYRFDGTLRQFAVNRTVLRLASIMNGMEFFWFDVFFIGPRADKESKMSSYCHVKLLARPLHLWIPVYIIRSAAIGWPRKKCKDKKASSCRDQVIQKSPLLRFVIGTPEKKMPFGRNLYRGLTFLLAPNWCHWILEDRFHLKSPSAAHWQDW